MWLCSLGSYSTWNKTPSRMGHLVWVGADAVMQWDGRKNARVMDPFHDLQWIATSLSGGAERYMDVGGERREPRRRDGERIPRTWTWDFGEGTLGGHSIWYGTGLRARETAWMADDVEGARTDVARPRGTDTRRPPPCLLPSGLVYWCLEAQRGCYGTSLRRHGRVSEGSLDLELLSRML